MKLVVTRNGIKEVNYTEAELKQIEEQKQQELLNPTVMLEPVDQEKVAMAEAIIDLEARLSALENK